MVPLLRSWSESRSFHRIHFSIAGPPFDVVAFPLSGYDTDRSAYLNDIYNGSRHGHRNSAVGIDYRQRFPAATGAGGYFANPGELRMSGLTLRQTVE